MVKIPSIICMVHVLTLVIERIVCIINALKLVIVLVVILYIYYYYVLLLLSGSTNSASSVLLLDHKSVHQEVFCDDLTRDQRELQAQRWRA